MKQHLARNGDGQTQPERRVVNLRAAQAKSIQAIDLGDVTAGLRADFDINPFDASAQPEPASKTRPLRAAASGTTEA